MKRIMIGFVAAGLLAATVWTANAATRTWLGGSTTWDDSTTANWSGGAVPVNGDTANITSNSAVNLDIGYTATGLSGLGTLTLSDAGAGTNTLFLDNSDTLTVSNLNLNAHGRLDFSGGTLTIPASSLFYLNGGTFLQSGGILYVNTTNGTGPYWLSGSSTWTMTGGVATTRNLTVGSGTFNLQAGAVNDNGTTGVGAGGVFNQTGGTFTEKVNYINMSGGTYNLSGGTNVAKQFLLTGTVTINQSGGLLTAANGFEMRVSGTTYNLSGGTATFSPTYVGYPGTGGQLFNHTGGILNAGSLFIAWSDSPADCNFRLRGGTLSAGQTVLEPRGVLEGFSAVTFNNSFKNNGRVIADGLGTDTNLDLSTATSILNTTDNTTIRGWFAVNKGKLILPKLSVSAGASTVNWGEAAADTTIDLVNSARLSFTGATAGNLTGTLFAADSTAVPTGLYKPVGIWSFAGVTSTTAIVTFRYDDAKAAALGVAEANLRVWRYNGATWENVTDTRDNTAKTITSLSGGLPAATTFIAVAPAQPPTEPPVLQNRPVSNVMTNGATFNGTLVTNGGLPSAVYVLWGENNGALSGSWAHTNGWNAGDWADNSFPSTNISLSADKNYYYTFGASNTATNAVADFPQSFITGELTAQATDPTGRVNAVDTMTFTVARPVTCTNESVIVNYTLGGTATNVTDYTIAPVSGAVVIAQGQTSGTIVVSPVYKVDVEKTVVLTLTPGAYAIGTANSATGTLAAVLPTTPTTRIWVGGNGTWDETTTNNWNPKDVPHNGDTVNITSNSAVNLSIDYTAAILVGNGLNALTIGNAAGATNTLTIDGSDLLPTATLTLNAGGAIKQTGGTLSNATSATISGGTFIQSGGLMSVNSSAGSGPSITGGGAWIMSNGVANTRNLSIGNPGPATFTLEDGVVNDYWVTWIYADGTFNQNGGSFNQKANYMAIGGSNSVLNMRGGTNSNAQIIMNGLGVITINQTGGVITNSTLDMRETGPMTYNLSGGSAYFSGAYVGIYVNSRATFNHSGGTLWCNQLLIGKSDGIYDCTYTLNGGTLNINLPNNAQAKVYPRGTFQGYGTVSMINYQFENNGRVIADGYGNNTNLDLTTAGALLNATDNTSNHGWFAVNKGRLQLPKLSVSAGSSTINWGEAAADTSPDLVNSARLAFTGATAGSLTGALYSVDRADIPAGLRKPVGVWSFGGVTSTVATLTFRYNDAAAAAQGVAEADLRVWKHNGTKWVNITDTRDNTAKTITSLAAVSSVAPTFFAVAPPPSSGTMILIR